MVRPRRKIHPGDLVARSLFAMHGVEANVEDMRYAGRGAWDMPWGGHRVTKNGDPLPAEGLDAWDGRALAFDGDGDILTAPDSADFDFGSGEPFSVITVQKNTSTVSEFQRFQSRLDRQDNTQGFSLHQNPGSPETTFYTRAASASSGELVKISDVYNDGSPHLITGIRDAGNQLRIAVDGDGIKSSSSEGSGRDLSSTNPTKYGIGGEWNNSTDVAEHEFPGTIGLSVLHPQWITGPQHNFLNALLRGNVAPGTIRRLQSLVYGHRETGLKRRIPSWLDDDYWGSTDYFWDPSRHPFGLDGERATQIPDQSGTNFITQRTGTDKGSIVGPTKRGRPADYLECGASTHYASDAFPDAPDSITVLTAVQGRSTASANGVWGHRDVDADPSVAHWIDDSGGNVHGNIGKGGSFTTATLAVDPTTQVTITAMRVTGLNTSSQSLTVWAEDGTGIVSVSKSSSYASGFSVLTESFADIEPDGSYAAAKDLHFLRRIDGAPTDTEIESMIATLSARFQ